MGISYFDVWKKRMINNGDIAQSRLNNSKNIFNDNFKDDPSYRLAKLKTKESNEETELDIRLANDENNPLKKKMLVRPDTIIEAGDYITYTETKKNKIKTHLVLSVEDNLISPLANTQECNHLLKWMYKGNLYSTLSLTNNATKYTEGTKEISAGISEIDARYSVVVPDINKTRTIKIGCRFIINGVAWEVTQTDYTTNKGLITLTLGKSSVIQGVDDVDNEIANRWEIKHNYNTTCDNSLSVTKGSDYNLVYSFTDNNQPIDSNLITIDNTSNLISIIKSTDGKITVTGVNIGTGSFKVKLNLTDEVREFIVTFDVVSNVIPDKIDYKVTTSNGYEYRVKEGSQISAFRYVNGIVDDTLQIDYILSQLGQDLLSKGSISIVKKTQNSLQIRNEKINTSMTFTLTIVNKTTGDKILDNQVITLKGVL